MDPQDITIEELDALASIDKIKKFVIDRDNNFKNLPQAVWDAVDSVTMDKRIQYAEDICNLIKKGYLVSDAVSKDDLTSDAVSKDGLTSDAESEYDCILDELNISIEEDYDVNVPPVKGITQKGQSAIDQWEIWKKNRSTFRKILCTLLKNLSIEINVVKMPESTLGILAEILKLLKLLIHRNQNK